MTRDVRTQAQAFPTDGCGRNFNV